jgi:DNA-binding transcriptional LysR family regulator
MRANPGFRLCVDQTKVAARHYDLCIYASDKPPEKEGHYQLLKERILVVVPTAHPLAGKSSVGAAELKGEIFLSLNKSNDFRDITDKLCERLGFAPQFTFEFDNPSFLREMLVSSVGISFLPEITWGANNTAQTKALELQGGPFFRHINIAWDPARYLPAMAKRFRDFIIEYYKGISEGGLD